MRGCAWRGNLGSACRGEARESARACSNTVGRTRDGLVTDHKAHLLPLQSADGAELNLRDQVERRGLLLLMEVLAVEKIHERGGVGGAKHCKPSVLGLQSQSQISSHAALDFGGAASDVFRTMRDKGVGRLRKFTAFCIENGISLACSLSLSHTSSKSQTPKAKRNLVHLRSHALPLETHTERRED